MDEGADAKLAAPAPGAKLIAPAPRAELTAPAPQGRLIAPGAVHVPGWLDPAEQQQLVTACRDWARPPAGMRAIRTRGGVMSARTVCLGWHWSPYRYSRTVVDGDGSAVKPFPSWLSELGQRAVAAAFGPQPYEPDVALVNFYDAAARMGMHQDRDERSPAPVVSLSLGDSAVFRFGNTDNRNRPWQDVLLDSGDLFVFGGPSRLAYHGITRILPGTGPAELELPGRLNVTLRESGL